MKNKWKWNNCFIKIFKERYCLLLIDLVLYHIKLIIILTRVLRDYLFLLMEWKIPSDLRLLGNSALNIMKIPHKWLYTTKCSYSLLSLRKKVLSTDLLEPTAKAEYYNGSISIMKELFLFMWVSITKRTITSNLVHYKI